jgi:transcriptional regulator with XRE-family HTH domain
MCKEVQINPDPQTGGRQLGELVASARRERDLTQEDLALAAGISTRTLHNLETGASAIRIDTLLRVLQVLGLGLNVTPRSASGGGETA